MINLTKLTKEQVIQQLEDAKDGYKEFLSDEAINMSIKAIKQTAWIPVSKKLPKKRDTYEVTLQGTGELEGIDNEVAYATWLGDWIYHNVDNWKDKKVIAWKPLSKPYKVDDKVK